MQEHKKKHKTLSQKKINMSKALEILNFLKTRQVISNLNSQRTLDGLLILNHIVAMKKGSIENLEHRQARMRWLIGNFGCRGERWDFLIRAEGGSTYLFRDRNDAIMFKMIWAGG